MEGTVLFTSAGMGRVFKEWDNRRVTRMDRLYLIRGGKGYYTVDGKNYHHIIDPKTLFPCDRYRCVSVVCRDSADGDALSTALFCMSLEDGLALIQSLDGVEAMWVFPDGSQRYSDGFAAYIADP